MKKKKEDLKFEPKNVSFRAWDKEENEMLYPLGEEMFPWPGWTNESDITDHYVLMQLVCIIPNFGAPGDWYYIYEGDIVEIANEVEGRECCSPTHTEKTIGYVTWDDEHRSFMIREYRHDNVFGVCSKLIFIPWLTPMRVCGNIFENRSLLPK